MVRERTTRRASPAEKLPWLLKPRRSDPPRKVVTRYLRWFTGGKARTDYLALYHLNVASDAQRAGFMDKVAGAMRRL